MSKLYKDTDGDGVETYTPALAYALTHAFYPLMDELVNKAADFYEHHGDGIADDAILKSILLEYFQGQYRRVLGEIKKQKQEE